MVKNVCFITTVDHNIGDDFVREGIVYLIDNCFRDVKTSNIHKHSPLTVVNGMESVRNLRISKLIEPLTRIIGLGDKIDDADVLIQSGAPVYWCHVNGPHCADNEWYVPLITNRFQKKNDKVPFLNIAGGSCQRYHSDGSEVISCHKCKEYIAEFYDACDLTILRDDLAKKMLNLAGRDADVLPCTSIFARDRFQLKPKAGEYIVVNFMENGGHYTFGQQIDSAKWRSNFKYLVSKLRMIGRVVASCHNPQEEDLIRSVCPEVDTYLVPNDYLEFMDFYSKARFGVVNRVHAGFMMASFGKPVAVIGNDSRALMIENLGLKSYYVDNVYDELIDEIIEDVLLQEKKYFDMVEQIRYSAKESYLEKISAALD